ncbi:MAG: AMP-binding protein [Sphingomonadales bacterium]
MAEPGMPRGDFILKHLPPVDQWPDFINRDVVTEDAPFNCAAVLLDDAVKDGYGQKIAIHTAERAWTYADLLSQANRIAHVLVDDLGLKPGGRVLLRGANNAMMAASWFGVVKAGGIAVSTMPMLRAKELITIGDIAEAEFALCDEALGEEMEAAAATSDYLTKLLYFNGSGQLEALSANKPETFENRVGSADDIALIAFTSGTTGKPKGALHSHHAVLAVCETYSRQVLKPTPADVFIGTPPLAFAFGIGALLFFPLHARAATVLLDKMSPEILLESIRRFKATMLFTAPTAYRALLAACSGQDLESLRMCVSAGEALPKPTTEAWLEKTGLRIYDGIGSTELMHIFLSVDGPDAPVGCLGKPVPGYEARIINEAGGDAAVGEIGLLAVRGPTGCLYLGDERQKKYVADGWNVTGDAARKDENGYFWYEARADDMIISAGYNIAAPDVEQTLLQHPAVAECGVVGVPDPDRGQVVKAYVVLRDGYVAGEAMVGELKTFAKQTSAPYKYPRAIAFIDQLPRTKTGKIQHFVLRELAKADAER